MPYLREILVLSFARSSRIMSVALCLGLAAIVAPPNALAQSWLDGAKDLLNQGLGNSEGGTGSGAGGVLGLSNADIADGLREALSLGSQNVTQSLGAADGFNADPTVRIPLPDNLKRVQSALSSVGMGALGEDVELRMNRAAETAMSDVGSILVSAIQAMTLEDAQGILNGGETAATDYLKRTSGGEIQDKIRPVVSDSLSEVGALAALDQMMTGYDSIPFMPDVSADLTEHATQLAYDGVFHYIAQEEQAIRANPAKRTTELLQRVFAQ